MVTRDHRARSELTPRPPRPIQWWTPFVLVPGLLTAAAGVSLLGADALRSAHWLDGLGFGFAALIALAIVLWSSRVASLRLAAVVAALFYVTILIGSHKIFWTQSIHRIERHLRQAPRAEIPRAWGELEASALYDRWIASTLDEPQARGWWAHLRANARAGLSNMERAPYEKGRPGYRLVHRTGWAVWNGWLWMTVCGALGSLLGIAGALFWTGRESDLESRTARIDALYEDVAPWLRPGHSESEIRSILARAPQPARTPIQIHTIRLLFPELDLRQSAEVHGDLELNRQLRTLGAREVALDDERERRAAELIETLYCGERPVQTPSWLPLVIAATRLHRLDSSQQFWFPLARIHNTLRVLGQTDQVAPFCRIDLEGIPFERVTARPPWRDLATGRASFHDSGSVWSELANIEPDAIPRGAHLAIVHQFYNVPDRRLFEMFSAHGGVEPDELVRRLGSRLRDALLTYIENAQRPGSNLPPSQRHRLARMAGNWPYEVAAPILERAVEAGWLESLTDVPETEEWRRFLDVYDPSPFGTPRTWVRWFEMYKREHRTRP